MATQTPIPERLTLREAAHLAGKTEGTVRRWVKAGLLRDLRTAGDRTGQIQLAAAELRAYLASLSMPVDTPPRLEAGRVGTPAPLPMPDQAALVASLEGQVADLRGTIADLRADRDRWRQEAERLRAELAEERNRGDALQAEMVGRRGIRGLLREALSVVRPGTAATLH